MNAKAAPKQNCLVRVQKVHGLVSAVTISLRHQRTSECWATSGGAARQPRVLVAPSGSFGGKWSASTELNSTRPTSWTLATDNNRIALWKALGQRGKDGYSGAFWHPAPYGSEQSCCTPLILY
jgi:hypothetical protein